MGSKADPSDSSPRVSPNELIMTKFVSHEAIIRLFIKKGIFTKEEFFDMVEKVNLETGGWCREPVEEVTNEIIFG